MTDNVTVTRLTLFDRTLLFAVNAVLILFLGFVVWALAFSDQPSDQEIYDLVDTRFEEMVDELEFTDAAILGLACQLEKPTEERTPALREACRQRAIEEITNRP